MSASIVSDSLSPEELRQRTRRGRLKMLAILLICAAPVIASYFTYYVIRPEGRTNYAAAPAPAGRHGAAG